MGHKGHWGEYTGNAKWSRDHAHTRVTSKNYDDAVKDDAAHIDYLKRDIIYDAHHGHSDEKMTADEKHISKLAGGMKYDKKHFIFLIFFYCNIAHRRILLIYCLRESQ